MPTRPAGAGEVPCRRRGGAPYHWGCLRRQAAHRCPGGLPRRQPGAGVPAGVGVGGCHPGRRSAGAVLPAHPTHCFPALGVPRLAIDDPPLWQPMYQTGQTQEVPLAVLPSASACWMPLSSVRDKLLCGLNVPCRGNPEEWVLSGLALLLEV